MTSFNIAKHFLHNGFAFCFDNLIYRVIAEKIKAGVSAEPCMTNSGSFMLLKKVMETGRQEEKVDLGLLHMWHADCVFDFLSASDIASVLRSSPHCVL